MDDTQKQVVERLKQANNILVTVRNNPTIDLLSACIGLALVLDKMDKHAAAVFSGAVPSVMEFLKPEETIERTPDSLRDFIIALDKSKADKLRYKVEDTVVRIFITPYKTSLSEKDLEFSQGDFNVDAVVALGAHEQEELDAAITAHGRIFHDAAIISINNTPNGNLGTLHWQDTGASSVSEMVGELVKNLGDTILDGQIATALLTGIVAETERFSNEKTTPETMNVAGELMAAGANQQLVATSLQPGMAPSAPAGKSGPAASSPAPGSGTDDGTLDIDHEPEASAVVPPEASPAPELPEPAIVQSAHEHELLPMQEPPHISNVHSSPLQEAPFSAEYNEEIPPSVRSYLVDNPALPGNTPKPGTPPVEPSSANPFDIPVSEPSAPLMNRGVPAPGAAPPTATPSFWPLQQPSEPAQAPPLLVQPPVPPAPSLPPLPPAMPDAAFMPAPAAPSQSPASQPLNDDQTLEEIEESVHSPHVDHIDHTHDLDAARDQVAHALQQSSPSRLEPVAALGANPLGAELHPRAGAPASSNAQAIQPPDSTPIEVDAEGNLKQVAPPLSAPPVQPPLTAPLPPIASNPMPSPPMQPPPAGPLPNATLPPPGPPPLGPPNFGSRAQL